MGIKEQFEREILDKLEHGMEKEKITTVIRRCPKCKKLTLDYDVENNRIICTACGFVANLPTLSS